MRRYSKIISKNSREIVLLKSSPCVWGKCAFCDYVHDNSVDIAENYRQNRETLSLVSGEFGSLEVINSASVFELDKATLVEIRDICVRRGIIKLYLESYYAYRNRLSEMREFFNIPIVFKCGIETFDTDFRNVILNKNIHYGDIQELARDFDSVCIMVGIKGQTKEMIMRDVEILRTYFRYGCVNVYCNNSTNIKQDDELIEWFSQYYLDWDNYPNIDVLYHNTDFGVGDE